MFLLTSADTSESLSDFNRCQLSMSKRKQHLTHNYLWFSSHSWDPKILQKPHVLPKKNFKNFQRTLFLRIELNIIYISETILQLLLSINKFNIVFI